jgi:hypothetical protein
MKETTMTIIVADDIDDQDLTPDEIRAVYDVLGDALTYMYLPPFWDAITERISMLFPAGDPRRLLEIKAWVRKTAWTYDIRNFTVTGCARIDAAGTVCPIALYREKGTLPYTEPSLVIVPEPWDSEADVVLGLTQRVCAFNTGNPVSGYPILYRPIMGATHQEDQ